MPKLNIQKRKSKLSSSLILVIAFVASLAIMIFCGYLWGAWTGFPKGHDAYAHMTRIKYLLDFFPNIDWQYHWANGMPLFKSYAPLHSYLGALLVWLTHVSVAKSLIIFGLVSYLILLIGIFGIVYTLTKKAWLAFLANVLIFSTFASWDWMVFGGNYPRFLGLALMFLTVFLFLKTLSFYSQSELKRRKLWLSLTIISLFLTMIAHVLLALFTCMTLFLIVLLYDLKRSTKYKIGFGVIFSAFFLAAYFLLPLLFSFGSTGAKFIGVISETVPMQIAYIFTHPEGIGFMLLPLVFFLLIINLFLRKSKEQTAYQPGRRFLIPAFIMFLFFLTYALIGHTGLSPKYYYINGFIPLSANIFLVIFGSLIVGLSLGRIADKKGLWPKISVGLIFGLLIVYAGFMVWRSEDTFIHYKSSQYIPDSSTTDNKFVGPSPEVISQQFLTFPAGDNYQNRFAAYDPFDAVWFNYQYKIPQERDYYGQGILYPDWRYWFEQVVWKPEEFTMDEAKSAFDWFAIRWFADRALVDKQVLAKLVEEVGNTTENRVKSLNYRYLKDSGFSLVKAEGNDINGDELRLEMEIKNPSNILEAKNTPNILYIGEEEGYNPFFFNLTLHNFNSQKIIPVKGEKYIDSYKLSDLQLFDTIFLYSYQYKNKEKAYSLLKSYVEAGGNIIWEAWNSKDVLALQKTGAEGDNLQLPEPSPVSELTPKEIEGGWNFKIGEDKIFDQIDFNKFSPPKYRDTPWKVVAPVDQSAIRDWAKVILTGQGYPLIVAGQYGQGHILWTGFNFNYHITDTKNFEEANLLINIIKSLTSNTEPAPTYEAKFVNPNKREITIDSSAKGVLFRESFYPNWQAQTSDGQKLSVWYAGPGLMYVPLSEEGNSSLTITLKYQKSLTDKIGIAVSLISLVILIVYLLEGKLFKPILSRTSKKIYQNSTHNLKKWWAKDDEEE